MGEDGCEPGLRRGEENGSRLPAFGALIEGRGLGSRKFKRASLSAVDEWNELKVANLGVAFILKAVEDVTSRKAMMTMMCICEAIQ